MDWFTFSHIKKNSECPTCLAFSGILSLYRLMRGKAEEGKIENKTRFTVINDFMKTIDEGHQYLLVKFLLKEDKSFLNQYAAFFPDQVGKFSVPKLKE